MTAVGPPPAPNRVSAHVGFKLGQRKGLGHTVVGAQIEAPHAPFDRIGRGQDKYRQPRIASAQAAQDVLAWHCRQSEIEDQEVEVLLRKGGIGFDAGFDAIGGIARMAQGTGQAIGKYVIVFGKQSTHGEFHLAHTLGLIFIL